MAVLMALHDAEHALIRNHLRTIGTGYRTALIRRHLIDPLLLRAPCTQGAELVRNAPDTILVHNQHVAIPPSEAIWLVEILDMALDPVGAPAAVRVAQKGEIACALFCQQHVPVREHEQAPRVFESGRERRRGESWRRL